MVDRNIGEYNRVTASTDSYVRTNFNIKPTDEETRNVISSTFGVIKNNILQASQELVLPIRNQHNFFNFKIIRTIIKFDIVIMTKSHIQDAAFFYPFSIGSLY